MQVDAIDGRARPGARGPEVTEVAIASPPADAAPEADKASANRWRILGSRAVSLPGRFGLVFGGRWLEGAALILAAKPRAAGSRWHPTKRSRAGRGSAQLLNAGEQGLG